jgi:hypothetical protein
MAINESLAKLIIEDRRLVILRLLACVADYTLNSIVLNKATEEQGHSVSYDVIKTDVAWLSEQGLLTIKDRTKEPWVITLTMRGKDAASGHTKVPGVKVPEPGLDD